MKTPQIIGLALLIAGAIALYFGFNASQSFSEEIGEAITGKYSDETMMWLIGGAVSAVVGVVLLIKK